METASKTRAPADRASSREGVFSGFGRGRVPFLGASVRGLASVEYAIILTLVSVGATVLLYGLGLPFVRYARFTQLVLGLPIP